MVGRILLWWSLVLLAWGYWCYKLYEWDHWIFSALFSLGWGWVFVLYCAVLSSFCCFSFTKTLFYLTFHTLSLLYSLTLRLLQRAPKLAFLFQKLVVLIGLGSCYCFVLLEKHLREILKHYAIFHLPTKLPFSLVNCMDPNFSGFSMEHFVTDQDDACKAHSLGLASKLAYEKSEIVRHECMNWGFSEVHSIRWKTTKGFVAVHDDIIVVSFAGTDPLDLSNVLTDLRHGLVPFEDMGYVHEGFLDALGLINTHQDLDGIQDTPGNALTRWIHLGLVYVTDLASSFLLRFFGLHDYHHKMLKRKNSTHAHIQVLEIISNHWKEKNRAIWLTGHSLGGALATVLSAKLIQGYPELVPSLHVYTYGQPRTGDSQFCQWIDRHLPNRFFRFVLCNDIIPRLPFSIPSWMALLLHEKSSLLCKVAGVSEGRSSYDHVGQFIYINSQGRILLDLKNQEIAWLSLVGIVDTAIIQRCQEENWIRVIVRLLIPFFLNDHFISDYVTQIHKKLHHRTSFKLQLN